MADPTRLASARSLPGIGLLAAALIGFMDFRSGGFFPDTTSIVTLVLLLVLIGFASMAGHPLSALRGRLAVAVGALGAFAVWQLVSSSWSHAPGRAALESNRTLLYLIVLVAAGLLIDRPGRVRALVLGIGAGLALACVAGLLARTLPSVFPVPSDVANERLGWPVTYWNALGLMGSVAIVLCLGLSGSDRESTPLRAVCAGLVPPLATTVLFTFSRGSIAAGAVGVVLLAFLSRRRALVGAALAALPPAAIAVLVAYHADALARTNPTGPDAVSQGHRVIAVVAVCALAAAGLRVLLARTLDARLAARRPLARRTAVAIGAAIAAVAIAGAAIGVAKEYDRFLHGSSISVGHDQRTRLLDPGNNGRLDHWRVAMHAYDSSPLHGAGSGTYEVWWNRLRPHEYSVLNAHSLYIEELGEVGIVGLALLLVALLTIVVGLALRARGPDAALWATATAAVVAWALEAGVDWVWQMPAATAWVFALGGAALARPAVEGATRGLRGGGKPGSTPRLLAGLALLLVAITPVRIALSQAHLRTAINDLQHGDCQGSVSAALSASGAFGARAEPYELLAYCDARLGYAGLARQMVDRAISRDPLNWQYRYDLAIVEGAAGRDPRPAIAEARRLNPLSGELIRLQQRMRVNDPQTWGMGAPGGGGRQPPRWGGWGRAFSYRSDAEASTRRRRRRASGGASRSRCRAARGRAAARGSRRSR
jgi:hypothetical protein